VNQALRRVLEDNGNSAIEITPANAHDLSRIVAFDYGRAEAR